MFFNLALTFYLQAIFLDTTLFFNKKPSQNWKIYFFQFWDGLLFPILIQCSKGGTCYVKKDIRNDIFIHRNRFSNPFHP